MQNESKIQCPNCGTEINVNQVLSHQLEEQIKNQYAQALKKKESDMEALQEKYVKDLEDQRKAVALEVKAKLKKELEEEQSEQLKTLQKELEEKSEKVKELNASKAEILKLKREKDEAVSAAKLAAQEELSETLEKEFDKLKKQAQSDSEMKIRELEKQLEDQKKLTEEMKRKQEQGLTQRQGEVQELAIEEWLETQFPLDSIEEIKKGARGGDCLQIVHTRTRQNCGTIYYESKRTKAFQPSWIEKFKEDIRDRNADIGVLVTEVLPNGMDRMGLYEGVWVCTFEEFKGLAAVLRESLIQISRVALAQHNRGDKMNLLYDYLTSNEFHLQICGIVEGFTQMKVDLEKERNAMLRIWKKREKQLEKVLLNTAQMHGSLQGIAGNAIQAIPTLELPEVTDEWETENS